MSDVEAKEIFQEEEELREILKSWGHQHDCAEAGCTKNPQGREIPPGKPARRKRTGFKRARELWRKHRGSKLRYREEAP